MSSPTLPQISQLRFASRMVGLVLWLACAMAGAQSDTPGPKLDVPFGPTGGTIVDTMLRMANVTPRDFVIDLGSGDGRINIAAALDYGARGIGYELDPALVRDSTALAGLSGAADKVRFVEQDLFTADLSRATVVTLYLGPMVTPRVQPKLLAELQPGTRVVSNNFRMGDWKPDATITLRVDASTVYFWWVPARVAGVWRGSLDAPEGRKIDYRLDLRQTYQEVDGEVAVEGARVLVRDFRIEGARVRFLLQEQRGNAFTFRRFLGVAKGDLIEGHFIREQPPSVVPFRMTRTVRAEPGPPGAWTYARPASR